MAASEDWKQEREAWLGLLKFALECLTEEKDSWKNKWYDEEPYSEIAFAIQKAEGIDNEKLPSPLDMAAPEEPFV